jgi:hypothetical protein
VELTNFNTQLSRQSLDFGGTTRSYDENLAGTQGDGFKVGVLVMLKKGFQVRYEASKFYWGFCFDGRRKNTLYCRLTKIAPTKLEKLKREYARARALG